MAKQKTKRCVMDTVAEERDRGCWTFATDRYEFFWREGIGINLFLRPKVSKDLAIIGDYSAVLYAKNLDHAVMWAWGYECGVLKKSGV